MARISRLLIFTVVLLVLLQAAFQATAFPKKEKGSEGRNGGDENARKGGKGREELVDEEFEALNDIYNLADEHSGVYLEESEQLEAKDRPRREEPRNKTDLDSVTEEHKRVAEEKMKGKAKGQNKEKGYENSGGKSNGTKFRPTREANGENGKGNGKGNPESVSLWKREADKGNKNGKGNPESVSLWKRGAMEDALKRTKDMLDKTLQKGKDMVKKAKEIVKKGVRKEN